MFTVVTAQLVWRDNCECEFLENRVEKCWTITLWCSIPLPLWPFLVCLHFSLWLCFCAISLTSLNVNTALLERTCKCLKYCQSFGVLTGAINKQISFTKWFEFFSSYSNIMKLLDNMWKYVFCSSLIFLNRFNKMMRTPVFSPTSHRAHTQQIPCLL